MLFKYFKSINKKLNFSYSTTTTTTTTNDYFKANEMVIAFIRNKIYDGKNNSFGSLRLFKLNEKSIFRTKYFDIMHKHIINQPVNKCNFLLKPKKSSDEDSISITFKRPSLYEYISNIPHVAVPSQYGILAFVPFLLELDKSKKILESGTGNGSMTLFLSQYLDAKQGGLIHTFDIKPKTKAELVFNQWKESYNLRFNNETKWFDNVEFITSDVIKHEFEAKFNDFYDVVYLDLSKPHLAIKRLFKLLKVNGILLINCMHLTQIIRCLNVIDEEKLNLVNEILVEPSTRLWQIERYDAKKDKVDYKELYDNNDNLNYLCRVEDQFTSKYKRDGLFSSHWPGFLAKFRKIC